MAPPKDIARSYPKRGLTADVGFRSEPFFCGDGSFDSTQNAGNAIQFDPDFTFTNGLSVTYWMWHNGENATRYNGFFGQVAFGSISAHTLRFHSKQLGASYDVANAFEARSWHHVCFTLSQDGTAVKCYLNGVEQTLSAQPASALTLPSGSGITDAGIATFQNNASAGVLSMGGHMAKYALYNAVLTEDQVRQIMRAQTFAEVNAIQACQFYFELAANNTDSTGNATTVEDRGTVTYGVTKPQLPRGLDLARGAAQAKVYTGRCVDFDGTADRLIGATYDGGGTETTMLYWFNTDTTAGLTMPFVNGGASNSRNQLQTLISAGILRAMDGPTNIPFSIETGRWYMLAIVGDSGGLKKAYLDGVDGGSPVAYGHGFTINQLVIGARNNTPSQPFNGKIVGFKIFDVELTQAQIRELYHNPEQVLPTGVSASNLRRYYPLSDYNDTGGTGGRYFQDMGADGEPAEDKGSALMAFAQPVPCPQLGLQQSATRLFFSGAGAQSYVATVTPPGTTATLSGWILWGDTSRTSYLVAIAQVIDATDSLNIRINSFGDVTMYKGTEYDSGLNINEGEWNHIVVTTKSTSPYWRCWVNGVEASSPAVAPVTNITTGFVYPGSNSTPFPLNGFINDVAFWDAELDTSDVAALYNSGVQGMDVSTVQSSNLKGWWKADDLTAFKDYSGNGANAVQTGSGTTIGASFPENASGSTIVGDFSMKRKGVSVLNFFRDPSTINSRAVIPAQESVFPKYPDGFTVSVFFRLQKRGIFSTIYYSTDGTAANQNGIYVTNANQIWFEAGDGGGSATRLRLQTGTLALDGDWHHYAATITHGTPTTGKAYFDGVLNATDTSVTQTGSPALSDLTIGDYMPIGSNEAAGPIACLRFYRGPLSDDEIEQIYNSDLRLIKGLENV
jgi:hypothetical protein